MGRMQVVWAHPERRAAGTGKEPEMRKCDYCGREGSAPDVRGAKSASVSVGNYRMPIEYADRLAAEAAEITHQHPLGYIPAAMVAHIIYRLATNGHPTRQDFIGYVREASEAITKMFPKYQFDTQYMGELAGKAISLAGNDKTDVENIEAIGGGWTGEEALAIALYCATRHFDNFEEALIAAVNHAGDSDSTGAITGNILGAAIGYEAIPKSFLDDLELHDIILHMADDLYRGEVTIMEQL